MERGNGESKNYGGLGLRVSLCHCLTPGRGGIVPGWDRPGGCVSSTRHKTIRDTHVDQITCERVQFLFSPKFLYCNNNQYRVISCHYRVSETL